MLAPWAGPAIARAAVIRIQEPVKRLNTAKLLVNRACAHGKPAPSPVAGPSVVGRSGRPSTGRSGGVTRLGIVLVGNRRGVRVRGGVRDRPVTDRERAASCDRTNPG